MEVELPLVNNSKCKSAFSDTPAAVIDMKVICAGYLEGKKDSCRVFNAFDFIALNFLKNVLNCFLLTISG